MTTVAVTLAAGLVGTSLAMLLVWFTHLRTGNAGIVDAAWAISIGSMAIGAAAVGEGWPQRRIAIALVMAIWGGRLGLHILRDRVIGKPEDGRYRALRREWGPSAPARMLRFFQIQALAAVFFAMPAVLASANRAPGFTLLEQCALALWAAAFSGEVLADHQLEQFRSRPGNSGRTCRSGLWRYSRHPNYFFEWVMWVAYAAFALASPFGALALLCPVAMLYLLLRVTGVPLAEAQALRSRGSDYMRYQQTTNAFFPWRPRA